MTLQWSHMTLRHSHMTLQWSHMTLRHSHQSHDITVVRWHCGIVMWHAYIHTYIHMHTVCTIVLAIAMETVYKRLHFASWKIVRIQCKILVLCVKREDMKLSSALFVTLPVFPPPPMFAHCSQVINWQTRRKASECEAHFQPRMQLAFTWSI